MRPGISLSNNVKDPALVRGEPLDSPEHTTSENIGEDGEESLVFLTVNLLPPSF